MGIVWHLFSLLPQIYGSHLWKKVLSQLIYQRANSLKKIKIFTGNSLMVHWVGLYASTAKGMGLIPDWGTKIPHSTRPKYICVLCLVLSCVRLFETPWTVAREDPLSMGFSRQEYWSGLPLPSPGDLPDPEIEPGSPTLQANSLPSEPPGIILSLAPIYSLKRKRDHFIS